MCNVKPLLSTMRLNYVIKKLTHSKPNRDLQDHVNKHHVASDNNDVSNERVSSSMLRAGSHGVPSPKSQVT